MLHLICQCVLELHVVEDVLPEAGQLEGLVVLAQFETGYNVFNNSRSGLIKLSIVVSEYKQEGKKPTVAVKAAQGTDPVLCFNCPNFW